MKKKHQIHPKKLSVAPPKKSEYEKDFHKWLVLQSSLLKSHKFDKLDIENLVEEIESLGRSDRLSIKSALIVLLSHMLKLQFQPEGQGNSKSWQASIRNSKNIILDLIEESPSLKKYPNEIFDICYERAIKEAQADTGLPAFVFPRKCPWKIEELLN